jgi:hypothetical protein
LTRQTHQREKAALYEVGAAVREAFFGNVSEARRRAKAAVALSRNRDVEYGAAFAFAAAGATDEAQTRAQDLQARFPEDTCVQFTYLLVLRGLLALKRGEPSKAIDLLQPAAAYDLAIPGSWFGFSAVRF